MGYLLLSLAFFWFAFIAPAKTVIAVCATALVMVSIVKLVSSAVVGKAASFGEAFKAIGLSAAFMAVTLFTYMSFSAGTGQGVPLVLAASGFLISYILGFRFGLGTSFGASTVIAFITTAISVGLFVAVKPILG